MAEAIRMIQEKKQIIKEKNILVINKLVHPVFMVTTIY